VIENPPTENLRTDYLALTAAQLATMACGVISVWLSVRLLGPAGYGVLALLVSALHLLYVIGIQWTMAPIVRFGREALAREHATGLQAWSWLPLPGASFLAAAALAVAGWPWLSRYAGSGHRSTLVALLAALAATTLSMAVNHLLQMTGRMRIYAGVTAAGRLALAIVLAAVAVAAVTPTPAGILVVMALALTAQSVVGLRFLVPHAFAPIAIDWEITGRMVAYSSPLLVGYGAGYLSNWIDVIVLRIFRTAVEIGVYHVAYQVMLAVTSPLIGIVTLVMPTLTAWRAVGSDVRVRDFLIRRIPQASVVWAFAMPAVGLLGRVGLEPIFGPAFEDASRLLSLLLVAASFQVVSYSYSPIYASYDLLGRASAVQVLIASVNVIGDLLAVPRWGAMGAAAATAASYALGACFAIVLGHHRFRVSVLGALLPPTLASMALVAQAASRRVSTQLCATAVAWGVTFLWARRYRIFAPSDLKWLGGWRLS
jgi:O-antigen/teichoic acid export membrane protein